MGFPGGVNPPGGLSPAPRDNKKGRVWRFLAPDPPPGPRPEPSTAGPPEAPKPAHHPLGTRPPPNNPPLVGGMTDPGGSEKSTRIAGKFLAIPKLSIKGALPGVQKGYS